MFQMRQKCKSEILYSKSGNFGWRLILQYLFSQAIRVNLILRKRKENKNNGEFSLSKVMKENYIAVELVINWKQTGIKASFLFINKYFQ